MELLVATAISKLLSLELGLVIEFISTMDFTLHNECPNQKMSDFWTVKTYLPVKTTQEQTFSEASMSAFYCRYNSYMGLFTDIFLYLKCYLT